MKYFIYFLTIALFLLQSCEEKVTDIPSLSTNTVSEITTNSAKTGGTIISTGGGSINSRGVCYSTSPNPSISDYHTSDGTGTGSFESILTNLQSNTSYYVRAYAENEAGIAYGESIEFNTLPTILDLLSEGYTVEDLLNQGILIEDLILAGISIVDLVNAGATITSLLNAGVSIIDLISAGISIASLLDAGVSVESLIISGVSIEELLNEGITPAELYDIGVTHMELFDANVGVGTLEQIGVPEQSLLDDGLIGYISDIENNTYRWVKIGNQIWMAENLRTLVFNDGSRIYNLTSEYNSDDYHSDAFRWYDDDSITYHEVYGPIYNYYAFGDERQLCPVGWHVPKHDEWLILENYLGGNNKAGGALKETGYQYWDAPNDGATNSSGFTGRPGGFSYMQVFTHEGTNGFFGTNTLCGDNDTNYYRRILYYNTEEFKENSTYKTRFASIRCIKDQ